MPFSAIVMKQTLIFSTGLPTMSVHRLPTEPYGCRLKVLVYWLSIVEICIVKVGSCVPCKIDAFQRWKIGHSVRRTSWLLWLYNHSMLPPKLVRHTKKINLQHHVWIEIHVHCYKVSFRSNNWGKKLCQSMQGLFNRSWILCKCCLSLSSFQLFPFVLKGTKMRTVKQSY